MQVSRGLRGYFDRNPQPKWLVEGAFHNSIFVQMDIIIAWATQGRGSTLIFLSTTSVSPLHMQGMQRCTHVLKVKHIHLFTDALPTPIIHTIAGEWTFTSPDGSQVERYIVKLECSVQNITFVEKYMSVRANSGGTGRVAKTESCFGGLGHLYRVKVWAVSGHNISQQPAVRCLIPDGQCREGRERMEEMWCSDLLLNWF